MKIAFTVLILMTSIPSIASEINSPKMKSIKGYWGGTCTIGNKEYFDSKVTVLTGGSSVAVTMPPSMMPKVFQGETEEGTIKATEFLTNRFSRKNVMASSQKFESTGTFTSDFQPVSAPSSHVEGTTHLFIENIDGDLILDSKDYYIDDGANEIVSSTHCKLKRL